MNYALIYSKLAGDEVLEIFRESTFSTLMNFPMAFSADKLSLWTVIRLYILNLKLLNVLITLTIHACTNGNLNCVQ